MPDIMPLIATRACLDTVAPDNFLDDLCLDPVDLWGLRDDIERAFNVEITDDAMHKWQTVADVLETAGKLVTV